MTDSGGQPDERAMVGRARDAISPTGADADRVRRSLRAALAAGASAPDARAGDSAGAARASWGTSKLAALAMTALVAGGVGFWGGRQTATRTTAAPAASSTAALLSPASKEEARPLLAAPAEPASSSSVAASPSPPALSARRIAKAPRAAIADRALGAGSLDQEVRALRGVERALRQRQPGLALGLLATLDREIPAGKLLEEREAMSVIARCARGDAPLGVDLGELFGERHADSVYLKRVQQACAEGTTRSPSPRRIGEGAETQSDQEAAP